MLKAFRDVSKDWSIPVFWFLVAAKQYYMGWEVAQLYAGGALIFICGFYVFFNLGVLLRDVVSKVVLTYFLSVFIFGTCMCFLGSGTLQGMIDILIFPVFFLFFYVKVITGRMSMNMMLLVAVIFVPFAVWNAFRWRNMYVDMGSLSQQSNAANFVTALIPFLFMAKNKVIRWICFAGIAVALTISMKRSGFVIFALFALYELFFSDAGKRNFLKRLGILLVGGIALGIGWSILSRTETGEGMLSRLSRLGEDGGSGRIDLFFYGWKEWAEENLLAKLIGNGPVGSSEILLGIRQAYHNDFVEVLRTSGALGLAAFVCMFVVLCVASWKYRAQRCEYREVPFLCMLFFLVSMGMFSPLVGFTYYTMPTVALAGASFAFCRLHDDKLRMLRHVGIQNPRAAFQPQKSK